MEGPSYKPLPEKLQLKKAIVNVNFFADNACFKWAILSALYLATKDANRVSKYDKIDHKLKFPKFPTPITDIHKFERENNISVNLYGCNIRKECLKGDDWLLNKIGTEE
jgi:hypothetical protein